MEVEFPQRQSQPELDVQESPFQSLIQLSAHVGAQAKVAEVKRAAATMVDFILDGCICEVGVFGTVKCWEESESICTMVE